jgi:hypothetical protein
MNSNQSANARLSCLSDAKSIDKQSKQDRLQKKLHHVRSYMHATAIQTIWRGRCARIFSEQLKSRTALPSLDALDASKKLSTGDRSAIRIQSSASVSSSATGIVFQIHCGINFPYNAIATRIFGRLMDTNYKEIDSELLDAMSNLDSDARNPQFNQTIAWNLASKTNGTVLLRLDTLERPSLRQRCIGYALLDVFRLDGKTLKLNEGTHLLRLFHGNLPTKETLQANMVDKMKLISDAYLVVSMSSKTSSSKPTASLSPRDVKILSGNVPYEIGREGTCASVILQSFAAATGEIPWLEITPGLRKYRLADVSLSSEERADAMETMRRWLSHALRHRSPSKYIFKGNIRPYNPQIGLAICLDQLYKMPSYSIPTMGYERKDAYKQRVFKVYGSYLSGDKTLPVEWFDLSKQTDAGSHELSPSFLDQALSTCQLSTNTCLLLHVIALDVHVYHAQGKATRVSANRNNKMMWWSILPLFRPDPFYRDNTCRVMYAENDKASDTSTSPTRNYFVNSGTHLLPLFQGSTPASILAAEDPFNELMQTILLSKNTVRASSCCAWRYASIDSETLHSPQLDLSEGSSAIIRLVDSQLPELACRRLTEEKQTTPSMLVSDAIVAAKEATKEERARFVYNRDPNAAASMKESCSPHIDFALVMEQVEGICKDTEYYKSEHKS